MFRQDTRKKVFNLVDKERKLQEQKWSKKINSTAEWMMILGEEYGEACKEGCNINLAKSKNRSLFIEEVVQVAAVAFAILEDELEKKE